MRDGRGRSAFGASGEYRPLVSVVIANRNYGRFLRDAIDSVLAQTYPRTEVIVVDDGSTDDSREVIARYGGRIRAILNEHEGQAAAFNLGFAESRGELVNFLDADDVHRPTVFERAVPLLRDPAVVKVHWPMECTDEDLRPLGRRYPRASLADGDHRAAVCLVGPSNCTGIAGSGSLDRRSYLRRIFPIPTDIFRAGCDALLFETAPFFGPMRRLEEPLSLYRQHGRSVSHTMPTEARIRRAFRFYDHICSVVAAPCRELGFEPDVERWKRHSWWHRYAAAVQAIASLPDPRAPLILVDDQTWFPGSTAPRPSVPFLERDGAYAGAPPDDDVAIAELERLRREGCRHLAFAWDCFWWLDHYARFHRHLARRYARVVNDRQLIVFDLKAA